MITLRKYESSFKIDWDNFISKSKNGTFLFYRDYMDYHAERFIDHSLIFFNNDEIIAVFPANQKDSKIISHGGLTYGGIVCDNNISSSKMLNIFELFISYFQNKGVSEIIYKTIPYIYHSLISDEDLYALFRNKAQLFRRDYSTCIDITNYILKNNRKNGFNKALKKGAVVKICNDYEFFFNIVKHRLKVKYNLEPAHTASEMQLLASKFPNNIKLYGVFINEIMIGGTIIYENKITVHSQYLSFDDAAHEIRGLDLLLITLLTKYYCNFKWFDFGISTENEGTYLNESLVKMKEEFGGYGICYDSYKLILKQNEN